MRSKLVALVLIAFCAGMSEAQDATAGLENSVVKVFSSMRYRDPYKPGAKQAPADATGSGVVISGNRILTNAHVVMFAGEVQVRANQSGNKLTARVETLARDIDLAILKLEDGAFFKDHPPLLCAGMDYVSGLMLNQGLGNMVGIMTSSLIRRMLAARGESLVVVAAPFFPHRLAQGYSNPMGLVLQKVNGTPVKSLTHLVELLRDQTAEFVTFEFEGAFTETLVFPNKEMAATEAILTDNGVRSQGSPDTLAVWNLKSTR